MSEYEPERASKDFLSESYQNEILSGKRDVVEVITAQLYDKYVHEPPEALQAFCEVGGTPSGEYDIDFDFEKEAETNGVHRLLYLATFVEVVLTGCPDQPMLTQRRGNVFVVYDRKTHEISFEEAEEGPNGDSVAEYGS